MSALTDALACTRCGLSTTRTNVVLGSGPQNAQILLIGEAPGRHEDEGGEPFIGRSGQLLFRLIGEEMGRQRDECFVTNVVKCRPPGNRTPRRGEITACRDWLDIQRRDLRPAVTLTLGLTATHAVLGVREPMDSLHGRPVTTEAGVVIPTYHPAAALRQGPSVERVMRADLQVARSFLP
jgi:DNA polymerase